MPFTPPPPPPPPGKAASAGPKPIGVPDDYSVPGGRAPTPGFGRGFGAPSDYQLPPRTPLYFDGDELAPASFSPEKVVALQKAMVTAGLIGPKTKFRLGVWDDTTRGAYTDLLAYANAAGVDDKEALKRYAASGIGGPGEGAGEGRAPLTIRKSNPADLVAVADTVARATLGRKLRPEESARFAAAFQGTEVSEQTTAYNQAEGGGTMTQGPNAQAFMAERIRKEYGVEAASHDLSEQFGEFGKLLNEVGG